MGGILKCSKEIGERQRLEISLLSPYRIHVHMDQGFGFILFLSFRFSGLSLHYKQGMKMVEYFLMSITKLSVSGLYEVGA